MPHQFIHTHIEALADTVKSLSQTEDSYYTNQQGSFITLMVADGASQRLKTTGSLKPFLEAYETGIAPARYASAIARDVTAEKSTMDKNGSVRDIALAANQRLRENLESVYGEISSEAVLKKEPALTQLQEDPRYVRLILPICCITVARLDLDQRTLSYAHGGDTALFLLYRNGQTVQITPDQMAQHDDKMRREYRRIMQEHQPKDEKELYALATEARTINRNNGIFHNYEDEHGNTDQTVGVGVINGMPQLDAYLVSDTISLDDLEGVILTTDGMFWPAPLDETEAEAQARVNFMGQLIRERGLKGYLQALREEELADADGKKYQHFGKLDDATAIYLTLDMS